MKTAAMWRINQKLLSRILSVAGPAGNLEAANTVTAARGASMLDAKTIQVMLIAACACLALGILITVADIARYREGRQVPAESVGPAAP